MPLTVYKGHLRKAIILKNMILSLLILFIFEMQKLPKPILKIRDSNLEKEDFLDEYAKVVDDAMKVSDEEIR